MSNLKDMNVGETIKANKQTMKEFAPHINAIEKACHKIIGISRQDGYTDVLASRAEEILKEVKLMRTYNT